ncbi:hypothetical protein Q1695_006667 [Nippostrongylus brasiliensis]|nr:hypothetical protein Q1695_006667 [Nippostrongylus brasiliensis]
MSDDPPSGEEFQSVASCEGPSPQTLSTAMSTEAPIENVADSAGSGTVTTRVTHESPADQIRTRSPPPSRKTNDMGNTRVIRVQGMYAWPRSDEESSSDEETERASVETNLQVNDDQTQLVTSSEGPAPETITSTNQPVASSEGPAPQTFESSPTNSKSSRDEPPAVKKVRLDDVTDVLTTLISETSLVPPAPTADAVSDTQLTVVARPREFQHERVTVSHVEFEKFTTHPWSHLFDIKIKPTVCPYYNADLPASKFGKMNAAGYSGVNLFPPHSDRVPKKNEAVSILEAVGPVAIEAFRANNSYDNITELRSQGLVPVIPLRELAPIELQHTAINGLELDAGTRPVLYRVKSLFGSGLKLESVHIELPLPDRLDLHTVLLDQYATNIKTDMRGIDIMQCFPGDLIWVYSLAPTTKFAKTDMVAPTTIEEASLTRASTVWRVARFALIHRELQDTLGFVTQIVSRAYGTFKLCMQGHRVLVEAKKNRLLNPDDMTTLQSNSFVVAPFRPRQLDYMVFCCAPALDKAPELHAHIADLQHFPGPPPVPSRIRLTAEQHRHFVKSKLTPLQFTLFEQHPNLVIRFLEPIYGTTCGVIAACAAEASDNLIQNTVWSSPDINAYPIMLNFRIPTSNRTGWAIGRHIQGAYQTDLLKARITDISIDNRWANITAEVLLGDTTRFRTYILESKTQRIAVGTALYSADDRANPVLAMLENSLMSRTFEPNSVSWDAARSILAGDIELLVPNAPELASISVTVSDSVYELNSDQVNAINWFHKESPILVIDSAYGAGKSLCTAVMAEGAVEKGKIVLIAAVQNSALDVICAKLAELKSDHMRPVRYLNETLARDAVRHGPFDMGTLMEQFHETHADHLSKKDLEQFQRFAQHRQMLREIPSKLTTARENAQSEYPIGVR